MKTMKRALTLLMAVLLLGALTIGCATAYASGAYEPVYGTSMDFTKYLVVSSDARIPAETFKFTVEAGSAVDANPDAGTLAVLAGPDADKIVIADTTFTANQTTTSGTATDGIVNSAEKKYAANTVTVNLTAVKFPEPGVYRYLITETNTPAAPSVVYDSTPIRTLDVYVKDASDATGNKLEIEGYVMYEGTITTGPSATATTADSKSTKYVNEVETAKLTFSKEVSGNQGARDKFFKFTLTIEGAGAGSVVNVTVTGTTPTKTASTIYDESVMTGENGNGMTTLTADADGKIEHNFYLSHGDSVTVTGILKTATYSIVEEKEDYSCTPPANARGGFDDGNAIVAFTNIRTGVVPTGISMTLIPGAAVVVLALGALAVLNRKKSNT